MFPGNLAVTCVNITETRFHQTWQIVTGYGDQNAQMQFQLCSRQYLESSHDSFGHPSEILDLLDGEGEMRIAKTKVS